MALEAKICGVNAPEALDAAVAGGAAMIGLNFYPPSPRAVSADCKDIVAFDRKCHR